MLQKAIKYCSQKELASSIYFKITGQNLTRANRKNPTTVSTYSEAWLKEILIKASGKTALPCVRCTLVLINSGCGFRPLDIF